MYEKIFPRCLFALAIALSGTLVSCDDDDPEKRTDQVAPAVSFENLDDQEEITGTLSIKIDATDNHGIAAVKFYIDNILTKTLTTPPFEFDFDTRTLTNGAHTLKVVAIDKAGNEKALEVEVTVSNTGQEETLLTIQVADDYLGEGEKPSRAFVVLHDDDWKVIASATVANGATVTLSSDQFDGAKFTVTELLVYESEGSAYLSATSYLSVPKGPWVLTNSDTDGEVKSVEVSFNKFTEGFGYAVSSNAGLSSGNSNVYVDITNPFATHLDLSVSPGKLFVRQYFNDGHNKFFMYDNAEIRDGGAYEVDFSVLDNADVSHELVIERIDFPASDGIVHLYGLPDAASTTEAYYLGQFHSGENELALLYPAAGVSPFAGYFSSTQFTTGNGAVAYNRGFGKFNTTPLAADLTVESAGGNDFVSTTGQFDFFMTHYSLGTHGDGTWFVIGPPLNNRKFKVFELPEAIAAELAFVDFDAYAFDKEFFLSDFAGIENYSDLLDMITSSEQGFPEAIDLLEEKNLMIDASASGFSKKKDVTRGRRIRDTFMNSQ